MRGLLGASRDGSSGCMSGTFANIGPLGERVRDHPSILTGWPHRYSSLPPLGRIRPLWSRRFGPGNSREQSCACGTAQWRGLRGARSSGRSPVVSPGGGKWDWSRHPALGGWRARFAEVLSFVSPHQMPCSTVIPLSFGHDPGRNECFRGHPGVAGRLRRVVVARRCTQHHLRRVMVETPPRAGPSPPHGPARFLCAEVGPKHRPEFSVPHPWAAHGGSEGRLRLRGLPHGQGPPAATTGPHAAACPIRTEGLTIT
jgi:hypothetical protein